MKKTLSCRRLYNVWTHIRRILPELREAAHPHVVRTQNASSWQKSSQERCGKRSKRVLHHCHGHDRRPFRQTASRGERGLIRQLKVSTHRRRHHILCSCHDRDLTNRIWDALQLFAGKIHKIVSARCLWICTRDSSHFPTNVKLRPILPFVWMKNLRGKIRQELAKPNWAKRTTWQRSCVPKNLEQYIGAEAGFTSQSQL